MIKRLILAFALLGLLSPAYSAGLYPLSNYQQFDANGKLMVGAKLYLFDGGTSTPRIGYRDSSLTSPHPNPIVADASGRLPLIYLADGFYRQRLTTKTGVQVFDQDGLPVLSTTAGGSGTSVDPDSVFKSRDIKIRFDNQPLAGYVRLNGRSIGSPSSGATERANVDTQPLYEELWAYSTIAVSGGKGASAAADFAANKPLVLPNAAGRGIFGMDDLGAGAQGVLTSATITNPTVVGSIGGFETVTLSASQLPSYTLTGGSGNVSASGTTGTESVGHTHSGTTGAMSANATHTHGISGGTVGGTSAAIVQSGGGASVPLTATALTIAAANLDHNHTFTTGNISASHTHTVSVTGTATGISISSGGGGLAFSKLPPALLLMIYIRL